MATAYKPANEYLKSDGRIFINFGSTLDLVARSDPNFTVYRNSGARVCLKDGETFEVLVRINGTTEQIMAQGVAKAAVGTLQPVYVTTRLEEACPPPADPAAVIAVPMER